MQKLTGVKSSNLRGNDLRKAALAGFSLLEVLVVVALIGVFSLLVLTQGGWHSDDRELDQYQARLHDTLSLLHEQSLFSGAMVGLWVQRDGWQPMLYDLQTQQFVALEQRHLRRVRLPPSLGLHWQLDEDDEESGLAALTLSLLEARSRADDNDSVITESQADDEDADKSPPVPQLFFFPSGEASPVTLTLFARDGDSERKLQLSALGQVKDPDQDQESR